MSIWSQKEANGVLLTLEGTTVMLTTRMHYSNKRKAALNKVFTYEKCSLELQKGVD